MRRMDELEVLYRNRLNEFVRVATAIAGDRERGLDAVHDAFTSAVRKHHRFRGEGTLEAWVWRIVVNAARDAARRTKPMAPVGDAAVVDATRVRLPLHLLTDRQREVLFLHYYADLDYATIGTALDISPGTVGATLSAARRTLRGALEKEVAS
jgi:DNA-directed RNA polymerase specialized sigma24 family protein